MEQKKPIKAVVLAIDSPGGSPVQSDLMSQKMVAFA